MAYDSLPWILLTDGHRLLQPALTASCLMAPRPHDQMKWKYVMCDGVPPVCACYSLVL